MLRYQNHTIEQTPTEKFPHMVTITKGTKKHGLVGKKFITEEKAKIAIEVTKAESLIGKGTRKASEDLVELGLGETSWS